MKPARPERPCASCDCAIWVPASYGWRCSNCQRPSSYRRPIGRGRGNSRHFDPARVQGWHVRYLAGETFADIARAEGLMVSKGRGRQGVNCNAIRQAFLARGLALVERPNSGRWVAAPALTDAQIQAAIAAVPRKRTWGVPASIKDQWRDWDLAKRREVCGWLKRHHGWQDTRPTGPYSEGCEPFEFGTPRAHAIKDRLNAGLTSRQATCHIRVMSVGVIWEDQLWLWVNDETGYQLGHYVPGVGRVALHRTIWERAHGPIGFNDCIRFKDGNQNNVALENLICEPRKLILRENQAKGLTSLSQRTIDALLNHHHAHEHPLGILAGSPR